MSATVKLESVRFVKRVSNGASLSKYGYIGMMQANAEALKAAPWRLASTPQDEVTLTTNQLSKTDGVWDTAAGNWATKPTYTAYMDDKYDCFNQAGDARQENATMCGYAGCVAYRFKLPEVPQEERDAQALESVTVSLQRDRYLRSGVRIAMQLSNSETPSANWDTEVRGEGSWCVKSQSTAPAEGVVGVTSFGVLGQPDVSYLTASRADGATVTISTSNFSNFETRRYLYLYLTLEDPAGYWNMYKAHEKRQYYIEGSAMLLDAEFTFAQDVTVPGGPPDEVIVPLLQHINLNELYALYSDNNSIITNDMNLHLIAGCDVAVLSRNGAPVVRQRGTGDSATLAYGMNGYEYGDILRSLGGHDSVESDREAVRAVYAEFYGDRMIRCPIISMQAFHARFGDDDSVSGLSSDSGASFAITLGHTVLSSGKDLVALHRKKLLSPFTVPRGFKPRKMTLAWQGYPKIRIDPSTQAVENQHVYMPCCLHNVWIAQNRNLAYDYSSPTLQRHELYTAETGTVGEFRLIGSIRTSVDLTSKSFTLDIPVELDQGPHTLLFTLFFDQDQFNYLGTREEGYNEDTSIYIAMYDACNLICPSRMSVRRYALTPGNNQMGAVAGMPPFLPYGWAPDVTLIG